jgi:hypothetical protein
MSDCFSPPGDAPGSFDETRDAITRLIFMSHAPARVDLALVLGSPSISNILPAIALYLNGMTGQILITGHGPSPDGAPEWRVYRDHALAAGVPEAAILIEPEARNTRENFALSARLIERDIGWSTIGSLAICSKPLHTRRALMTARRHFPRHIALLMIPPAHPDDIQASDWWRTPHGRERVMGEMRRIGEYAMKGDLAID